MNIRFWGTRGSIPSPGPPTVHYGGNTSCVEVRLEDGTLIILDAGSGIRPLGATLGACDAVVLLSHYHWDHIQGFPFFNSAYIPTSSIRIFGPEFEGQGPEEYLSGQMMTPYFPAAPSQMHGVVGFHVTPFAPCEPFEIGTATIRVARLSHPSVTLGYRIEERGSTFVYISDNEVDIAPPDLLEGIIALAAGADVLIHDCQYTEGEYVMRRNFGHSTPRQAVRVAREAGARRLITFHHDPSHDDEQVEALAEEARALAGRIPVSVAAEGETISLRNNVIEGLLPRQSRSVEQSRLTASGQ
jgi:phosphoribosyl 1,2-cyclic phosphodiesterase